jgi:hypothetical protein
MLPAGRWDEMTTSMARSTSHTVARVAGGLLLVAHGAIHGMGAALLWELGEPGALTYADGTPTPGTAAGIVAGLGWAVGGALFVVAGVLLLAGRRWAPVAAIASVVSLPPVAMMASNGPMGVAIDVAVLVVACATIVREHGARSVPFGAET